MKTNLLTPQTKTRALSVAVIALTIATIATGTLAYFTDTATAHNVITSGGVDIELIEKQKVGNELVDYPEETITGVMPATEVSKIVTVQNNDAKAWVRVAVTKTIELQVSTVTPNPDFIEINYNKEKWVEKNGYWYYKVPLEEGETTEPLFTTVKFSEDMGNEYQNCTVNIEVTAEAIQYANMTETAMTTAGWHYIEETETEETEPETSVEAE